MIRILMTFHRQRSGLRVQKECHNLSKLTVLFSKHNGIPILTHIVGMKNACTNVVHALTVNHTDDSPS